MSHYTSVNEWYSGTSFGQDVLLGKYYYDVAKLTKGRNKFTFKPYFFFAFYIIMCACLLIGNIIKRMYSNVC